MIAEAAKRGSRTVLFGTSMLLFSIRPNTNNRMPRMSGMTRCQFHFAGAVR